MTERSLARAQERWEGGVKEETGRQPPCSAGWLGRSQLFLKEEERRRPGGGMERGSCLRTGRWATTRPLVPAASVTASFTRRL